MAKKLTDLSLRTLREHLREVVRLCGTDSSTANIYRDAICQKKAKRRKPVRRQEAADA